ncbi:MAG: hypothetical protein BECKG1743D_GA0114223_101074 [Candidatus Kentron sp. G]|nr:MAG: hypothetical protein BECKG1743E_GA0114224_101175 [Candidatus Kentron sp. G]VFM99194.1 MAG: hypothetical protein BECKG1743D_GA0114223_101074 [Candidatus Kentron sp. G]VFN05656.1 MAG: hypothetical protein BECKG1743F_GA0114225_111091 [Candidatus Kentron sp. G]
MNLAAENTSGSHGFLKILKLENILFWTSVGGAIGACIALGIILSGVVVGSIVSVVGTVAGGMFGALVAIWVNRKVNKNARYALQEREELLKKLRKMADKHHQQ